MKKILTGFVLSVLVLATSIPVALAGYPSYVSGQFQVNGKFKSTAQLPKFTNVAANYTILTSDYIIRYTATTSAYTATLPPAAQACSGGFGQVFIIKDASGAASTHNITVDGNGAETIDGAANKVISANYGYVAVQSNCTSYNVIGTQLATGTGDVTTTGTNVISATNTLSGVNTFSNVTDSTSKDTGGVIHEGGIGVEKAIFGGSTINALTNLTAGNGTVLLPSIGFVSDPDSGLYRIGANNIGISVNAAKVLDVLTTGLGITGVATVSGTTASTTKDTGSIITEGGLGVEKAIFAGESINAATLLTSGNGAVGAPAITPVSDPDTGIYVIGANNLGIAANGAKVLDIGTGGLGVTGAISASTNVTAGDGAVGTPSLGFTTDPNSGLYVIGADHIGAAVNGAKVLDISATGLGVTGQVSTTTGVMFSVGTANTGVTAVTYGDGKNFTTFLAVSQADAVTVADNSALADGYKLFDFPAGAIVIHSSHMSMALTLAEDTTATLDGGLGMLLASAAQATLDADNAACENVLTGQTFNDANGTAEVKTVGTQLVIESADSHALYFNIADTWADTAGMDLSGDIAGTVTIHWTLME